MKECPVCGWAGLAADLAECPQCNADLESFALLDMLEEQGVAPHEGDIWSEVAHAFEALRVEQRSIHETLQRPQGMGWRGRHWAITGTVVIAFVIIGFLVLHQGRAIEMRLAEGFTAAANANAPIAGIYAGLEEGLGGLTRQLDRVKQALSKEALARRRMQDNLTAMQNSLSKISEHMDALDKRMSEFVPAKPTAAEPVALHPSGEAEVFSHKLAQTETLWSVARRYYGSGIYYPLLLEHNPGLGVYFPDDYGAVRILADSKLAKALYERLAFMRDGRRFFRYKVQPGDTWRVVAKLFFGDGGRAAELASLNGRLSLLPGERVVVPLDD